MSSNISGRDPSLGTSQDGYKPPVQGPVVTTASVNEFLKDTPLKTALSEGLHRPTQAEIQGMPDDAVNALNKQEIQALVALLPRDHQEALMPSLLALKQIQVGVDMPVRAKIGDEWRDILPESVISREQYDALMDKVALDSKSNRGSLIAPGTPNLHRVGAANSGTPILGKIRDHLGQVVDGVKTSWASLRIGRSYVRQDFHLLDSLKEQIVSGRSVLIVGVPGSGKTTLLRAIAQSVADDKNAVIVEKDAHNEIGGSTTAPHPVLGKALRMSIEPNKTYDGTLKEAVANSGADVLITDEIKTRAQAETLASGIADGLGLVATAHGKSITSILQSPDLAPLTGGTQQMTISDASARANGGSKQVTELGHTPPIDTIVVMKDRNTILVYDYRAAADQLLNGKMPKPEVYPVNRRNGFDFKKGTGEDPTVFLRKGNIGGEGEDTRLSADRGSQNQERVYEGNLTKSRLRKINGNQQREEATNRLSNPSQDPNKNVRPVKK
jgi:stage III sporulation protein SpoIIIAA